jgi:hypothetical protein
MLDVLGYKLLRAAMIHELGFWPHIAHTAQTKAPKWAWQLLQGWTQLVDWFCNPLHKHIINMNKSQPSVCSSLHVLMRFDASWCHWVASRIFQVCSKDFAWWTKYRCRAGWRRRVILGSYFRFVLVSIMHLTGMYVGLIWFNLYVCLCSRMFAMFTCGSGVGFKLSFSLRADWACSLARGCLSFFTAQVWGEPSALAIFGPCKEGRFGACSHRVIEADCWSWKEKAGNLRFG